MKYKLEIINQITDTISNSQDFLYETINEVIERIKEKKSNETVSSIIEYHLVYQHSILLPSSKKHEITKHEIYGSPIKIPKNEIRAVTQKSYVQNFINEEEFYNYCIRYEILKKHQALEYYHKQKVCFDYRSNNRKAIMKALYQFSKSNQVFNLQLYQYRYLSQKDIL